ncbi:MAG: alpha/beta hydrolase, partial [Clostridia bacterium]
NDYCEIIRLIQKKENIQKFHIIAHSFGGRVAILFASRYNESVDKILLTGSAGLKSKFSAKRQLKILKFKLLKKLGFKNLEGYGSSDYRTLPNVMKKTFVNIINQQLEKECAGITQQTLLVFGENDSETPIYMAKKFKRLIKNSEIIIFKNCAHFAYLENPQLFLKIAKSFLKG